MRNVKPLWSKFGTYIGVPLGGVDMWLNDLFGFSLFGTLKHGKPDYATLKRFEQVKPIVYPKPDGVLTFDSCPRCSSPTPITRKTSRSI